MKKILCPIDFTPASMNALEYAFEVSQRLKSELILFHSIHPSPQENTSLDDILEKEEKIKEKLEEICEAHARQNHYQQINYWFLVRTGLAVDAILNLIRENQIDMVVTGTKGAEGLQALLGTLSSEIAAKAPCPVIIIPENFKYRPIKNIVYATDLNGDENSNLNYVITIAQFFQAEVSILNIQKKLPNVINDRMKNGENMLRIYQYPNLSFHVLEMENITEGIRTFSKNNDAELLVMSASDRSLFEKFFTKSQTREMALHTEIPFLVMHKEKIFQAAR